MAKDNPKKFHVTSVSIASDDYGEPFMYGDVMSNMFNMRIIGVKVIQKIGGIHMETMQKYANMWANTHNGAVIKVTEYSFEFQPARRDGELGPSYVVMASYFLDV